MRTVEEIQNVVFSAFENMLNRPEMYLPCSPEEFEARLSSYLWVLAISENAEADWSAELEMIRQREGWSEPLDIMASLKSALVSEEPTSEETSQSGSQANQLIARVIDFYEEMAQRLGFVAGDETDSDTDDDSHDHSNGGSQDDSNDDSAAN